jgi:hypothetical protein
LDAAYEAVLLATKYICDLPDGEKGGPTKIRSTDANVARDCLKLNICDHQEHIEHLATSLSHLLKS